LWQRGLPWKRCRWLTRRLPLWSLPWRRCRRLNRSLPLWRHLGHQWGDGTWWRCDRTGELRCRLQDGRHCLCIAPLDCLLELVVQLGESVSWRCHRLGCRVKHRRCHLPRNSGGLLPRIHPPFHIRKKLVRDADTSLHRTTQSCGDGAYVTPMHTSDNFTHVHLLIMGQPLPRVHPKRSLRHDGRH